jgi:hypothetical protein
MKFDFLSPHIRIQKWIIYFLVLILLEYLVGWAFQLLNLPTSRGSSSNLLAFVFMPLLWAYYFLPVGGLAFIPALTLLDIYAFFEGEPKERKTIVFFLFILGIFNAYLIWWWLWTDHKWDYI